MNIPADLRYTTDHEWVRLEGNVAVVGITDYAQKELGDIVYVDINTLGDTLDEHAVFGTVEAVKTVSDLYLPIAGKVTEFNEALVNAPETVNQDPYGEGWMVKVELADAAAFSALLSAEQYQAHIGA